MTDVDGYCPMGCGQTLVLGEGGYITCSFVGCPRPGAVAEILQDRETEHIVDLGGQAFTVRHPLRERLDDALLTCQLHTWLTNLDGPPRQPGRYRARQAGESWTFQTLAEETAGG